MVVDFPAPFGPRKPCTSPVRTVRSSPSSARVWPKVLTRPDTEMAVVMASNVHWFHKVVKLRKRMNLIEITRPEWRMRNVTTPPERRPSDRGVGRFVERFALLLVESGMPRMPARVFGALLVAEDGKLTAGELAEQLRVSPAAISGAVRYLAQVGLVVRARDPGERRDHYEVTDDLWYEVVCQPGQAVRAVGDADGRGRGRRSAPDTRAGARLDQSRKFFEFLREELPELMRAVARVPAEHGSRWPVGAG